MTESRKCVLLVEDEPGHAEIVRRLLEREIEGVRVVWVRDGGGVIDLLTGRGSEGSPLRPHLILLDLRLPRTGGLEVLAELKGDPDLRAIPVVVLTTSEAPSDRVAAYAGHANGYLVKPNALDRFEEMVRSVASFWLEWNQVAGAGGLRGKPGESGVGAT